MIGRWLRPLTFVALASGGVVAACAAGSADSAASLGLGNDGGAPVAEDSGGTGSGGQQADSAASSGGNSSGATNDSGGGAEEDSGGGGGGDDSGSGNESGSGSGGGVDSGGEGDSGGGADSGGEADSGEGTACSVSGVSVTYKAPASNGHCSANDISTFASDCLDDGDCSGDDVSSACFACLYTSRTSASSWGALVVDSNVFELNQGGCYAAQGAAESACAEATEYQQECENTECASYAGGLSATLFEQCASAADMSASKCACYVANATSACQSFTSSDCNPSSTAAFDTAFEAIAAVMCE